MKIHLNHYQVRSLCSEMATSIKKEMPEFKDKTISIYGIPRGGVPVAYMLAGLSNIFKLADSPINADCFVDDIIDSGATKTKWLINHPEKPFFAMINKFNSSGIAFKNSWIVFPWEHGDEKETEGVEDNITRLLQFVGEDPTRGGLLETPKRVAKAWTHYCSGYEIDVPALFKTFEDGAKNYDEMIIVKDIPFYSHCEHHLAAFFGAATVAYIPNGKIVGLSKLSRVVNAYAKRLQVQERLTSQIAEAIHTNLLPKGVGVVIKARHLCMEARGIAQQGHHTITSSLWGVLRDKPEARAEFLELAR